MRISKIASDPSWQAVADEQGGLVSRQQLIDLGLTRAQAAANVDNGRWQRVHPGVYATFTGPIDASQQVWAALLHAGPGSAACCSTALWLCGVLDRTPDPLHISIPEARRVRPLTNVRMHRCRALNRPVPPIHPVATPPRIRVEVPHRLPTGARNLVDVDERGRRRFRDVEYRRWGLIVELDGREAHPVDEAFRTCAGTTTPP